ncbi:MAG: hypothetical protein FH747_10720 [Stenotrophomonas sp.]|nr:hypothetical protein [Stenotrophomonas sp.]
MDARMLAWTNPVLPSLDALLAALRLVTQWGDGPARLWQGRQTSLKGERPVYWLEGNKGEACRLQITGLQTLERPTTTPVPKGWKEKPLLLNQPGNRKETNSPTSKISTNIPFKAIT